MAKEECIDIANSDKTKRELFRNHENSHLLGYDFHLKTINTKKKYEAADFAESSQRLYRRAFNLLIDCAMVSKDGPLSKKGIYGLLVNRGWMEWRNGDVEEGKRFFNLAIEFDTEEYYSFAIWTFLEIQQEKADVDKCIERIRRSLQCDKLVSEKHRADLLVFLAILLHHQQSFEAAIDKCNLALELCDKHVLALIVLADSYKRSILYFGQRKEGPYYAKAMRYDPENAIKLMGKGFCQSPGYDWMAHFITVWNLYLQDSIPNYFEISFQQNDDDKNLKAMNEFRVLMNITLNHCKPPKKEPPAPIIPAPVPLKKTSRPLSRKYRKPWKEETTPSYIPKKIIFQSIQSYENVNRSYQKPWLSDAYAELSERAGSSEKENRLFVHKPIPKKSITRPRTGRITGPKSIRPKRNVQTAPHQTRKEKYQSSYSRITNQKSPKESNHEVHVKPEADIQRYKSRAFKPSFLQRNKSEMPTLHEKKEKKRKHRLKSRKKSKKRKKRKKENVKPILAPVQHVKQSQIQTMHLMINENESPVRDYRPVTRF